MRHSPPLPPRPHVPVGPSSVTSRAARPAALTSTVKLWGSRARTLGPSPGPEHVTFEASTASRTRTRNGLPVWRRGSVHEGGSMGQGRVATANVSMGPAWEWGQRGNGVSMKARSTWP